QARTALRLLDAAAQLPDPEDVGKPHRPTRTLALRRAACYTRLRQPAAAEREQALARQLPPSGAVDHFLLGCECYHRRDLAEAIHHFDQALDLQPRHYWARYLLALSYLRSQPADPVEARNCLRECRQRQPNFPWTY